MGLFDYVRASGPQFVCDQGHAVCDFQTKDLGCTLGEAVIEDDRLTFRDGGHGDGPNGPVTATIDIYGDCTECPAFVQARTLNLCAQCVEFRVTVEDGRVASVKRTSETLDEFLTREPNESYMRGCFGPMPYAEASEFRWKERHRREDTARIAEDA